MEVQDSNHGQLFVKVFRTCNMEVQDSNHGRLFVKVFMHNTAPEHCSA